MPMPYAAEVRSKYREVATNPHGTFHFHTGRPLAARLGYESVLVDALPNVAVEILRRRGQPVLTAIA